MSRIIILGDGQPALAALAQTSHLPEIVLVDDQSETHAPPEAHCETRVVRETYAITTCSESIALKPIHLKPLSKVPFYRNLPRYRRRKK